MKTDELIASFEREETPDKVARLRAAVDAPVSAGEFNDFLTMQNEFNLAALEYITQMQVQGDTQADRDSQHKAFATSMTALRAIIEFTAVFPARLLERAGFGPAEMMIQNHITSTKDVD